MAEEKAALREVHWRQLFPWLSLFRAFGMAVDLKKMFLAALGAIITAAGWALLAGVFSRASDNPAVDRQADAIAHWPWDRGQWQPFTVSSSQGAAQLLGEIERSVGYIPPAERAKLEARFGVTGLINDIQAATGTKEMLAADRAAIEASFGVRRGFGIVDQLLRSPIQTLAQLGSHWRFILRPVDELRRPFSELFVRGAGLVPTVFALACGVWAAVVWAVFGGAITRIAAIQFAREEKIGLGEAVKFACSKLLSFAGAPVIPLIFIGFFAAMCAGGGLISNIPLVGPLFAGGLWVLPLIAGFVMALIVIAWAAAWPLMFSTISVESSDSFDAISRSFAYVFHRPWHYLFYAVVAAVFGSVSSFFVLLCADLVVHMSNWAVAWGGRDGLTQLLTDLTYYAPEASGWAPAGNVEAPTGVTRIAAIAAGFWLYVMFTLLVGFVYSYFWSASTVIYYLLRRDVDNTELNEVFIEGEEEDFGAPAGDASPAPAPTAPPDSAGATPSTSTN
jgi:hypothetical protein